MATDNKRQLHDLLSNKVVNLPTDFQPYGERDRDEGGADCSCGCKHFLALEGDLGMDWGVCGNVQSPRCGLLTFEHQGCEEFEYDPEDEE